VPFYALTLTSNVMKHFLVTEDHKVYFLPKQVLKSLIGQFKTRHGSKGGGVQGGAHPQSKINNLGKLISSDTVFGAQVH